MNKQDISKLLDEIQETNSVQQKWDALSDNQQIAVRFLVGGGLVFLILYFNPYSVAELAGVLIPLLLVFGLLFGTGVLGRGAMQALSSGASLSKVKEYLEARKKAGNPPLPEPETAK